MSRKEQFLSGDVAIQVISASQSDQLIALAAENNIFPGGMTTDTYERHPYYYIQGNDWLMAVTDAEMALSACGAVIKYERLEEGTE